MLSLSTDIISAQQCYTMITYNDANTAKVLLMSELKISPLPELMARVNG